MQKIQHLAVLLCTLFAMAFFMSGLGAADKEVTLGVGDNAPAFKPSGWLNGEPITEFKTGSIYVVECWATWCGPCIAAIPHLSELNTKYKDQQVEIIGLNVWENDQSKVAPFVKKMGDKMNYRIALDKDSVNAKAWLTAAGKNGIPCSFLVDRSGKIAWIGHPNGLEKILDGVVKGTFDAKKYADEEAAKAQQLADLNKRFGELLEKADVEGMRGLIKETAVTNKEVADRVHMIAVIQFHKKKSYAEANALAEDMLTSDDSKALNGVAYTMLNAKDVPAADLKLELALKLALRASELTENKDAGVLDTLALGYFLNGDKNKAISTEKRALSMASSDGQKAAYKAALKRFKTETPGK